MHINFNKDNDAVNIIKKIKEENINNGSNSKMTELINQLENIVSCSKNKPDQSILVSSGRVMRRLFASDVLFITTDGAYVVIKAKDGKNYFYNKRLKDIEEEWSDSLVKINRSCLVSKFEILDIIKEKGGDYFVRVNNIDEKIKISRRCVSSVKVNILK